MGWRQLGFLVLRFRYLGEAAAAAAAAAVADAASRREESMAAAAAARQAEGESEAEAARWRRLAAEREEGAQAPLALLAQPSSNPNS